MDQPEASRAECSDRYPRDAGNTVKITQGVGDQVRHFLRGHHQNPVWPGARHHELMTNSEDEIVVQRRDLITVLRQLEMVVVSLDRIGSAMADTSEVEQALVLREFIFDWDVFRRLAKARGVLGEYFSRELGPDDLEELERELHDVPCWSASNQTPPAAEIDPDGGQTVDR